MGNNDDWHRSAACRGRLDLDWIDPTPRQAIECRNLCRGCPVQRDCVDHAIAAGEPWGIWGGLDSAQRADLAASRGADAPRVLPAHGTNPRYAKHGCRCLICRAAHTDYEHRRRRRQPTGRRPHTTMPDQATA